MTSIDGFGCKQYTEEEMNGLQSKLVAMTEELDEWRHGERQYPPATQDYKELCAELKRVQFDLRVAVAETQTERQWRIEAQARIVGLREALEYIGKEIAEGQGVCIETVVEALATPATILELCARVEQVEKRPPAELVWLYTHCCAIGMKKKSDSGKLEHDIALFTADLCTLVQKAEEALENSVDVVQNEYDNDWRHSLPTRKAQLDGMLKMLEQHKEAIATIKQFKEQT